MAIYITLMVASSAESIYLIVSRYASKAAVATFIFYVISIRYAIISVIKTFEGTQALCKTF